MTKLGTTLWIILTVILLIFPIRILVILLTKKGSKLISLIKQKIHNIKTLDKMRNELLQQRAKEVREENNINNDMMISSIFENKETEPDVEIEEQKQNDNTENINKNILEKQKKLLEKISYEANVYKKDGKLEEYEKKLIEGLAIEPDNLDFNKQLADLYFTVGNHKKALSLLKKIIEEDPDDHNAIRQIGEIYLISGDYETAELLIEKAINTKPNNPKYYISMVEILYNTERKKDAIAVMEKIVKLRPTNSNYALTLAELYEETQDKDNAKKYYFKVLEQEPNNEKAKRKIQELSNSNIE
ncbi:MAG TPA: tetratricopeptide repeat protein [Candidatus Absconditabacterales bacterium]|nr:tetratricopeptide repeat protein [Candidatus Absconditabacterales bacterium]